MKLAVRGLIVISLALACAVSVARAQDEPDPEARALFEQGVAHFQARDYEAAIDAFDRAFALDPRPDYLFAMAQAERLSGDCPSAIVLYRRFLELDPPEKHAAAADEAIDRCERALASRPEGEPAPEPEPDLESDASAAPPQVELGGPAGPPRDAPAPWYRDPVGGTLLGAGVLGLAVGATYYAKSSSDVSAANDADYDRYIELMDRAESRRTIAWLGLGAGTALVVAAGLRYWVFDGEKPAAGVAVSADADAAGVMVFGTF